MARPQPFTLIDTLREGSVSFAPPDPSDPDSRDSATGGHAGAAGAGHLVGTSGMLGGASRDGVSGYPIQVGKVQRPPLREETLARHRLLDWLDVKIHNRVVFVIAEAGYGKTTLLADFSRRTRLRTLWYRMDEEDRNWVTFMSYLVAAGREHDPEFAPRTYALLQDTGPGGPNRDEAVATFLRELPGIAPTPTVLILDDFHVTDGSGDVSHVARNLVAKAPERLTIVISSRRVPEIPVGRLRAQGELAELRTRDLQFSEVEISDLFNAGTSRTLDHESLGVLNRRSEGWAASLELIRTALRDRSTTEVRDFIRNLSGDQAELYDYLAEEVVGELRADHQAFLMRTSLLLVVTTPSSAAICEIAPIEAARLVDQSERLGLITRQGATGGGFRYHPLVREFLAARLRATIGDEGIRSLHEAAGRWAQGVDWRDACYHFEAASNVAAIHRTLNEAIDSIAGQGSYEAAGDYLRRFRPSAATASFEIIGSRVEFRRGNTDAALERAARAVSLEPGSDAALSNAITLHGNVGNYQESWKLARQLVESASGSLYRMIAEASCRMYDASVDGKLGDEIDFMAELLPVTDAKDLTHFSGISHLNIALAEIGRADLDAAISHADLAVDRLAQTSRGAELSSALLARAAAHAMAGSLGAARDDINTSAVEASASRAEWLVEAAEIEVAFGSADVGAALLSDAQELSLSYVLRGLAQTTQVRLALRKGKFELANQIASAFEIGEPSSQPGFKSRQLAIQAHAALAVGRSDADALLRSATRHAERQGASLWLRYCQALAAIFGAGGAVAVNTLINRTPAKEAWLLDAFAEEICSILDHADETVRSRIASRCAAMPERWLPALRRTISDSSSASRWSAATILDEIGTQEDIPTLRALAHTSRGAARAALGRTLARHLAPRFLVEDLGRVEVHSGDAAVPASSIRRKVLAMLCFLLSRPRFSATRDEVIDALWPDLSPEVAVNSLNQTVYFLRRVFEPTYVEDLSAGYVHHGSDVLWLDSELVSSRSARCLSIIDSMTGDPDPALVTRLSLEYEDRFALDFAYEEWAVPFRTSLHVAYLRVIEAAVTRDMASGHHDRAIELARRALERDPGVESLELALLRLYRTTGAHSAAAEQYAHYSAFLRDELGIEPPPLAQI